MSLIDLNASRVIRLKHSLDRYRHRLLACVHQEKEHAESAWTGMVWNYKRDYFKAARVEAEASLEIAELEIKIHNARLSKDVAMKAWTDAIISEQNNEVNKLSDEVLDIIKNTPLS